MEEACSSRKALFFRGHSKERFASWNARFSVPISKRVICLEKHNFSVPIWKRVACLGSIIFPCVFKGGVFVIRKAYISMHISRGLLFKGKGSITMFMVE